MSKGNGIYNAQQHQEEVALLSRGDFLQTTPPLKITASAAGLIGLYETEGNSLFALNMYIDRDGSLVQGVGVLSPSVYVRFNHQSAPWLPIGLGTTTPSKYPNGYVLTFGRFWLYAIAAIVSPILLAVGKGISMHSNPWLTGSKGNSGAAGPAMLDGYRPPTWFDPGVEE